MAEDNGTLATENLGAKEEGEQTPEEILFSEKDKKEEEQEANTPEENTDEENQDKEKDSEEEELEGAPEEYEDFTYPENFEIDEGLLAEAKPLFKELNLTQEQAQKLVDLQSGFMTQLSEQQAETWQETVDKWAEEAKSDKEIGGKAFDENVAVARTAVKEFASDGFKEMLDVTGVGNHPEMIRFLHRVGKAISDDRVLQGGSKSPSSDDPAKILFPDMA